VLIFFKDRLRSSANTIIFSVGAIHITKRNAAHIIWRAYVFGRNSCFEYI